MFVTTKRTSLLSKLRLKKIFKQFVLLQVSKNESKQRVFRSDHLLLRPKLDDASIKNNSNFEIDLGAEKTSLEVCV
jgi:hypothetical protein